MLASDRLFAVLAGLMVAVTASRAVAQDQLIVGSRQIGTAGHFGQAIGSADPAVHFGVFGGGRFAVSGRGTVRDLRTGAERTVTTSGEIAAVDPNRPRVFVHEVFGGLDAVDVVTEQRTVVWSGPRLSLRARYAAAVDLMFLHVVLPGLPLSTALVVVEASSGAVVRSLPDILAPDARFDVTDDGTRVLVMASGGLTALDGVTGATVGRAQLNVLNLAWDGAARRVLAFARHVDTGQHLLVALDDRLHEVARAASDSTCGTIEFSPHTGRIYFLGAYLAGATWVSSLTAFDESGRLLARAPVGDGRSPVGCDEVTMLTAPGPPRNVSASVSGGAVTLTWHNVGGASGFVLDIGLAPGRTDLQVFLGPEARAHFAGVPRGTYYLRLRGGNEFGGGRPSSELRVVVP